MTRPLAEWFVNKSVAQRVKPRRTDLLLGHPSSFEIFDDFLHLVYNCFQEVTSAVSADVV
jgi:hypothetical protein